MTYEERIAAAQAKMEALKAKMAAAAEYVEKYGEPEEAEGAEE